MYIFQNPREAAVMFQSIVEAIDIALNGWAEFGNNFYFNELAASGGFYSS